MIMRSGKYCGAASKWSWMKSHRQSRLDFEEGYVIEWWSKVQLKSVNTGENLEEKEWQADSELEHT